MLRKKTRPMNKEESELFIKLCITMDITIPEDALPPICNIMKKRLEWAGFKECVSDGLLLWCSQLSEGNPGKAVMWAWQLAYLSHNIFKGPIDINKWVLKFPFGVPTEDVYEKIWDLQKGPGDNLLDQKKYWPGKEKGDHLMKKWGIDTSSDQ